MTPRLKSDLKIPSLMPDELLLGYFGRLSIINGFENEKLADNYLRNCTNDSVLKKTFTYLPFKVEKLLNIPIENLIRRHTLLPLFRALDVNSKANHHPDIVVPYGNKLFRPNISLCDKCVDEDINYLGFSYWRRSHQLLGVDICAKHNHPLKMIASIEAAFEQPYKHIRNNKFITNPTALENAEDTNVKRFVALLEDYVDMEKMIDGKAISNALVDEARKMKLRLGPNGKNNLLSDLILESYPSNWIRLHFPTLFNKKKGEYLNEFDGSLISGTPKNITKLFLAIPILLPDIHNILHLRSSCSSNEESHNVALADIELNDSNLNKESRNHWIDHALKQPGSKSLCDTRPFNLNSPPSLDSFTQNALNAFLEGEALLDVIKRDNVNTDALFEILRVFGAQLKKEISE